MRSLATRLTLAVLVVFVISLWATLQYISHTLGRELRSLLEAQQFSTATIVADEINSDLRDHLEALQAGARAAENAMRAGPASMQYFLEQKPILQKLFNGGIMAHGPDGTAIADFPASAGRLGVNYMDVPAVSAALTEGRASICDPIMGKKLQRPVMGMAAPIRDAQRRVIGALGGVIKLGLSDFTEHIAASGYAKTGGYLLVNPRQRQIVAATDKTRTMELLPASGINPGIDWAMQGNEGAIVLHSPHGEEQLMAVKKIPITGWYLAITLPTVEAFAPIRGMQRRLLLIGVTMTILVGLLIGSIVKQQLAPMGAAAVSISEILANPQTLRSLPVVRDDEVGQLIDGFNHLIDEVVQREAALRSVQSRLEGTLDAIPDLLFVTDVDGLIYSYRASRSNLLAALPEEFVGKRFADVLPSDAAAACMVALRQAQLQGHSVGQQCQLLVGANTLWFELSVACKPGVDKTEERYVVLARDVTDNKQVQLELQRSRDDLRALANRLQTGREEQRAHLAREIHDVLAQELTRLKIDLSWMKRRLGARVDEPLRENLLVRTDQAMALVDSSITTVQRIATELRPVILDSLGLFAAIEWQVEDFAQRSGLRCHTTVAQDGLPPARDISIVLFRILQESLTNIARHAHATEVDVTLALQNDTWVLTVQDNGVGITEAQIAAHRSLGLLGMGERALAIGGSVHFAGAPLTGTTITARIPAGT